MYGFPGFDGDGHAQEGPVERLRAALAGDWTENGVMGSTAGTGRHRPTQRRDTR
ncbi:hypothetical protein SEA_JEPPNRM_1 [Mycobacterium phage JeppNRM]|nr:hypothetical protein SEA_JEPPNRM_1 [Mycobacterium phage JeppNRM]